MKRDHITAFDLAHAVAKAVDPTCGDVFKKAFVAAILAEGGADGLSTSTSTEKKRSHHKKVKPTLRGPDGRLTFEGAAHRLGFSTARLTQLRTEGKGPKGVRKGNRIWFTDEEVDAYAAERATEREKRDTA